MKYEAELSSVANCPPTKLNKANGVAFRFCHSSNLDEGHLPPAIINPGRTWRDGVPCNAFALSFFTTEKSARSRLEKLTRRNPKLRLSIGDQIGKVALKPADGVVTPPAASGHFDLFEAKTCSLSGRFEPARQIQNA